MRFLSLFLVGLLLAPLSWGETTSLKNIDFSRAQVSLAGPSSLYIRSVEADGARFSLYVERDPESLDWKIGKILPEEKNALPEDLILDFAMLKAVGDRSLEIGGILYQGMVYKGQINLGESGGLTLSGDVKEASLSLAALPKVSMLKELLVPYQEQLDGLTARNLALAEELKTIKAGAQTDAARLQTLEKRNSELGTEVGSMKAKVAELSAKNEELKFQIEAQKAEKEKLAAMTPRVWLEPAEARPPKTITPVAKNSVPKVEEKKTVDARVYDLETKVASLEKEVTALNKKLESYAAASLGREGFSKVLLQGFSGSTPRVGTWKVTNDTAEQTDARQHFAKLTLPVKQTKTPTLYSFKAKSAGKNWVGLGLHIFADNQKTSKGYGEGKSLLVWLTRDPAYYKTTASYLQVYRSDDDVKMERVLDAKIPEAVDSFIEVDVLYDPQEEYISLFLGGVEKVRYKTFFGDRVRGLRRSPHPGRRGSVQGPQGRHASLKMFLEAVPRIAENETRTAFHEESLFTGFDCLCFVFLRSCAGSPVGRPRGSPRPRFRLRP